MMTDNFVQEELKRIRESFGNEPLERGDPLSECLIALQSPYLSIRRQAKARLKRLTLERIRVQSALRGSKHPQVRLAKERKRRERIGPDVLAYRRWIQGKADVDLTFEEWLWIRNRSKGMGTWIKRDARYPWNFSNIVVVDNSIPSHPRLVLDARAEQELIHKGHNPEVGWRERFRKHINNKPHSSSSSKRKKTVVRSPKSLREWIPPLLDR